MDYDTLIAKSKQLASEGRVDEAKRVAQIALKARSPQKGMGQRLKEFFVGDNDPNTQNMGEKIGAALNKAGEAATFGLVGDESSAAIESALLGSDYGERRDHYRQQEKVLERDNPGVALGADVGGAIVGALMPGGAVGTLGKGAGLLPRVAASAAAGAGMGGTYGYMEGEGAEDRLQGLRAGATLGGVVGAAAPALGAGVQKVADTRVARRAIRNAAQDAPSTEALRAAGNKAYDAIDDLDVQIKPSAFGNARQKILDALRQNTGYDELPGPGSLTPKTARVMEIARQMDDNMSMANVGTPTGTTLPTAGPPTGANVGLPFKSLDQLRRQAGAAAGNVAEKADQHAGMQVLEGLDDFVRNLDHTDVLAGSDVRALKSAIPKARDVWQRMSKSQLIDDAIDMEGNYLSGGASAIRNRVATILRNPKLSRGFTEAEKKVLQRVVSGSLPQQILNYLGSGLGMMGQMAVGAVGGGLPGALAGSATAALARTGSAAITRRQAEIARAIMANNRLPAQLPVASDSSRRLAEALTRRGGAAVPQ